MRTEKIQPKQRDLDLQGSIRFGNLKPESEKKTKEKEEPLLTEDEESQPYPKGGRMNRTH